MPLPPLTTQYLTILLTLRRGATIFCRILAPPANDPPPPADATLLNYLNDSEREGDAIIFCRILASPNAPSSQWRSEGNWRPGEKLNFALPPQKNIYIKNDIEMSIVLN